MKADEAIVLVGGLGTRLRPLVSDLPKPLAPVAGRPFLAHLLDQLADSGLRRAILATGHLAEQIERTIGRHWQGMEIAYSHEPRPLGTGGAIRYAARQLQGEGVHLANGDTFLRYDLVALERLTLANSALMGMALAHVNDIGRYGAVEVDRGFATHFCEKGGTGPGLINAGSYYLTGAALATLPHCDVFSFEARVLEPLAADRQVVVIDNTRDFVDIGIPDDYRRAQVLLGAGG